MINMRDKEQNYYENNREDVFNLLSEYDKNIINKEIKILEIGCGIGRFKEHFSSADYLGVEINEMQAKIGISQGVNIINENYEDVYDKIDSKSYDVIVLNDIIEHMTDHNKILELIKKNGAVNFILIGSLPNVRFITVLLNLIIFKDWKYNNQGILDYTHQRYFTLKSIKRTLCDCGYEVIKIKGTNKIPLLSRSVKDIACRCASYVFGSDTKYMQFIFIAKLKKND